MSFSMWMETPSPDSFQIHTEHHRNTIENIPCLHCMSPIPQDPFKCPQCKMVRYCNKRCHLGHWARHKLSCEQYTQYKKSSGSWCLISGSFSSKDCGDSDHKPSKSHRNVKKKGAKSCSVGSETSKDDAPLLQCSSCNRCGDGLRTCSKCKSVVYCDPNCQRKHWPQHKKACKLACKQLAASQTEDKSKNDQVGDGKELSTEDVQKASPPENKQCSMCKEINSNAKKCSKCKDVYYCNAECQEKHWPLHKEACGKASRSICDNDNRGKSDQPETSEPGAPLQDVQCFFCKKNNPNAKKCSKCHFASYCNVQCQKKDFSMHKLACGNYPKFVEALARANTLLSNLHDREVTELFYPPRLYISFGLFKNPGKNAVLLEIVAPYHHFCRLGVFVQDAKGETYHILFHHRTDEEILLLPETLKGALEPGNFIRWFYPRWHLFADGEIGFRVDSLFEMEFIHKEFKPYEF